MVKTCIACELDKPMEDFNLRSAATDGHQSMCRDCQHDSVAVWEKEHPEQVATRAALYRGRHRSRLRAQRIASSEAENEHRRETAAKSRDGRLVAVGATVDGPWLCECCGAIIEAKTKLRIDRDRDTIRGLLCISCKRILDGSGEDTALLSAAINYLHRHLLAVRDGNAVPWRLPKSSSNSPSS